MTTEATIAESKTSFGFWIYLMTDCILFASLFATYIVLRHGTAGGPDARELFGLSFVLIETLLLLTSSFTSGLSVVFAKRGRRTPALLWLGVTMVLGLAFLGMELSEFSKLASEGNSWQRSGFLSAFFTLVGTHGLHITAGLIWAATLGIQLYRRGFEIKTILRRMSLFGMFWHFLDIVWIYIFTVVYLMGVAS